MQNCFEATRQHMLEALTGCCPFCSLLCWPEALHLLYSKGLPSALLVQGLLQDFSLQYGALVPSSILHQEVDQSSCWAWLLLLKCCFRQDAHTRLPPFAPLNSFQSNCLPKRHCSLHATLHLHPSPLVGHGCTSLAMSSSILWSDLSWIFAGTCSTRVSTRMQSQRVPANDGWLCPRPFVLSSVQIPDGCFGCARAHILGEPP